MKNSHGEGLMLHLEARYEEDKAADAKDYSLLKSIKQEVRAM